MLEVPVGVLSEESIHRVDIIEPKESREWKKKRKLNILLFFCIITLNKSRKSRFVKFCVAFCSSTASLKRCFLFLSLTHLSLETNSACAKVVLLNLPLLVCLRL